MSGKREVTAEMWQRIIDQQGPITYFSLGIPFGRKYRSLVWIVKIDKVKRHPLTYTKRAWKWVRSEGIVVAGFGMMFIGIMVTAQFLWGLL